MITTDNSSKGSSRTTVSTITSWSGLRRSLEAHLLKEGELSAARNMLSREGILAKRPGFRYGILRLEPATYWPQAVFHLDIPRENIDEGAPADPDEPPENGVIWGPDEPDGGDPEASPPLIIRRGGTERARKLRFVITLPEEIAPDSAFTLKIEAERWHNDTEEWKTDHDYDGLHADWRAYVYDSGIGGTTYAVTRSDLVIAESANSLELDPRYIADDDPGWTNGVWEGDVKLMDDNDRNTFRFHGWHGWRDKGEATAEINPAPCECPDGLDDSYVLKKGSIVIGEVYYSQNDCSGSADDWEVYEALEDITLTKIASCSWLGHGDTEIKSYLNGGNDSSTETEDWGWTLYLDESKCAWVIETDLYTYAHGRSRKETGEVPVGEYPEEWCESGTDSNYYKPGSTIPEIVEDT